MSIQPDLPAQFNVADYYLLPHLTARPEKTYMYCEDETLSYRALNEGTNQVAGALRKLGVMPEQRVMLLMLESLRFPVCFFGAIRLGAVAVPVSTMLSAKDYKYYLNDSRAAVLVVDAALWPQIEPIKNELSHLKHILIANGSVPGETSLDDLLAAERTDFETVMMTPDDPAFWLYTSGSTGDPKAAVHLHHDMVYSTQTYLPEVLGLTENDVTFSAAKFFFAYGLGNSLYFPLATGGASVVQPGRPTPELMFSILEKFKPTVFYGVPTLLNAMVLLYEAWAEGRENPPEKLPTLDFLRCGVSAGESLPPEIFNKWKKYFGSSILDGIGSTEMLHIFISNFPGAERPGSTGTIVKGFEAKILGDDDLPVKQGEIGTLLVKGDSAAAYYWNKHEKTKNTMLGAWLVTGDKYHQDADGYFWYAGRNDDMMRVSGAWVSPIEVENTLLTHAAVAESAVVGHPDDAGLIRPKAFVVLKSGDAAGEELAQELIAYVRGKISGFKAPSWVEFVEELPKTATGKIRRFELRY